MNTFLLIVAVIGINYLVFKSLSSSIKDWNIKIARRGSGGYTDAQNKADHVYMGAVGIRNSLEKIRMWFPPISILIAIIISLFL